MKKLGWLSRREALIGASGLAVSAGLSARSAHAQSTSGQKQPVRLVVGFPPGGGADSLARVISRKLPQILERSVIVETHPGANGRIGAEFVSKAKPDGDTLLISPEGAIIIGPHLTDRATYDPRVDLTPISLLAKTSTVLVVKRNLPVSTLGEFIALAKSKPNQLFYGSSGIGGPNHLAGEMFKKMAGIEIKHIPYRGTSEVVPAILSGEVDAMFGFVAGMAPLAKSGDVRPLAVGATARSPVLPDVPTMSEAGVPGYEMNSWIGAFGPALTPPAVVTKVREALLDSLRTPEAAEILERLGLDFAGTEPEDFKSFVSVEFDKYGKLLAELNIKE